MSLLRSLRAYVGLGPDEDYEDRYLYDLDLRNPDIDLTEVEDLPEDGELESEPAHSVSAVAGVDPGGLGDAELESSGRPRQAEMYAPSAKDHADTADRSDGMADDPESATAGLSGRSRNSRKFKQAVAQPSSSQSSNPFADNDVVRSLDRHRRRPRTITPNSFSDSKILADEFNRGVPIILDLQGQGRELSRRLIDFASGVCYVLDGSMEKVSPHVFLLVPKSAKVSKQDRRLIEEGGYDR